MRAFYCDHFVLPLPEGHRFPIEKYGLLRERVSALVELAVPGGATSAQLAEVHDGAYVRRVLEGTLRPDEVRCIGFPWSPQLVERSRRSVGGTIAAGRAALRDGYAANLAGGTHHAFQDRGGGFCVFNDVAVAVRALRAERRLRRCAVLDLDVHQGDGTAAIFAGDASVFTLSVHGASNYPFRKERSDLDIELGDGAGDDAYLGAVERGLGAALAVPPDLAFFVAGVDGFEDDRLGRLSVSKRGMRERDAMVFDACGAVGAPVAIVMAGGYARDVRDTVDLHAGTVLAAAARCGPGAAGTEGAAADGGVAARG